MHKRGREMTMQELEKNSREMTPEELKKFNQEIDLTVYPVISPKKQKKVTPIDLTPEEMQILHETVMTDDSKGFKLDDDYLKELDDYSFNMKNGGRRRRKTRKNSRRRSKKSRSYKKRTTYKRR